MATILLSDLIDEFLGSLRSNGYSRATVNNQTHGVRMFLTHVGNIQVANITPRHVDSFFVARQAAGLKSSSLNNEFAALRYLFGYAAQRHYLKAGQSPVAHRRRFREIRPDKVRVPASKFPALLDAAEHPRDRVLVAIGLYLFLRRSELMSLRTEDVDLDSGEVRVIVHKSAKMDRMPVSGELDAELRRWLTWYANNLPRNLRPGDFLVPALTPPRFVKGVHPSLNAAAAREDRVVDPARPVGRPEQVVQRALEAIGYATRTPDDRPLHEGMHTLRRSGARALFDAKASEGYDGTLRLVQSMLHHATSVTTEVYLGVHLDKKRRDDVVRGKIMFPRENVIEMGNARGAQEIHAHRV